MRKRIGVSIVSFNTRELLNKLLAELKKEKEILEVWVLDNNSDDGSALMVKQNHPWVNLIESGENTGFSRGQNTILKRINCDFALILNPDVKVEGENIKCMADFMDEKGCDIASCKIIGFDGSLQPNGGDLPFGISLISWLFNLEIFGNLPNFHRIDKQYYAKDHETGWVGGTFMMVKNDVFEKIGYFNEDYFMYFEDVELCYRAKKAGLSVMINPKIEIEHKSGASSKNPQFAQWKGEIKNLLKFYQENYGFLSYAGLKILIYSAIFLRIAAFFLMGKFKNAKTYGRISYEI